MTPEQAVRRATLANLDAQLTNVAVLDAWNDAIASHAVAPAGDRDFWMMRSTDLELEAIGRFKLGNHMHERKAQQALRPGVVVGIGLP